MPTTDWNWFFSSVAQSAAAIVGILKGFFPNAFSPSVMSESEYPQSFHFI
jgi:hypothetical protein